MTDTSDKLLWEAVRYVLAELPHGEREEFERRLIDDQVVREAVAEAVALCQVAGEACRHDEAAGRVLGEVLMRPAAVGAKLEPADNPPAANVSGIWRRAAVAAAMALAASIVFAFVLAGLERDGAQPRHPFAGAGPSEAGDADHRWQLAIAWLNVLPASDDLDESTPDITDQEAASGDASEEPALLRDEGIALVDPATVTNDWLFEAITAPPIHAESSVFPLREG